MRFDEHKRMVDVYQQVQTVEWPYLQEQDYAYASRYQTALGEHMLHLSTKAEFSRCNIKKLHFQSFDKAGSFHIHISQIPMNTFGFEDKNLILEHNSA